MIHRPSPTKRRSERGATDLYGSLLHAARPPLSSAIITSLTASKGQHQVDDRSSLQFEVFDLLVVAPAVTSQLVLPLVF